MPSPATILTKSVNIRVTLIQKNHFFTQIHNAHHTANIYALNSNSHHYRHPPPPLPHLPLLSRTCSLSCTTNQGWVGGGDCDDCPSDYPSSDAGSSVCSTLSYYSCPASSSNPTQGLTSDACVPCAAGTSSSPNSLR